MRLRSRREDTPTRTRIAKRRKRAGPQSSGRFVAIAIIRCWDGDGDGDVMVVRILFGWCGRGVVRDRRRCDGSIGRGPLILFGIR